MRSRSTLPTLALLVAACATSACTMLPVTRGPAPGPYAERPSPRPAKAFPNWPIHPHRAEEFLLDEDLVVETAEDAGAGTTGAQKVDVRFPHANVTLRLKWKPMNKRWSPVAERLDGVNNSPRKELAVWRIQRLFMDPEDYVVPTTVARCARIEPYRVRYPGAEPTLEGSRCVLGITALWLNDLTLRIPLLDNERFNRDYVYAYYLANLNLLTYLVKHHDGREGNFLVSQDDAYPQVFSIDNGVSFGGPFYNWFVANWNSIRVPAFRKESIDRLRAVSREDLERALAVVSQLEMDDEGWYKNAPLGKSLDPSRGVRRQGRVLQFGLKQTEIDDTWERIQHLIRGVDEGTIAVF